MKPDGLLSSEQLLQGSEAERSPEMAGEGEEVGRSLGRCCLRTCWARVTRTVYHRKLEGSPQMKGE